MTLLLSLGRNADLEILCVIAFVAACSFSAGVWVGERAYAEKPNPRERRRVR